MRCQFLRIEIQNGQGSRPEPRSWLAMSPCFQAHKCIQHPKCPVKDFSLGSKVEKKKRKLRGRKINDKNVSKK